MDHASKNTLVSPCGLNCAGCVYYQSKDNPKVQAILIAKGADESSVPCRGCRKSRGKSPALKTMCTTYKCTQENNVNYCFECLNFPCYKLIPAADGADTLPHNIKVFNLCYMKEKGLERWLGEAAQIQKKYFKGKMEYGKGPQL